MDARERILNRVRKALEERPKAELPSPLHPQALPDPVALLLERLAENGAEGARVPWEEAQGFIARFAEGFSGVAFGEGVPEALRPSLPELPPEEAPLGVSLALFAVAETGTVALSSGDGRRAQLLPPTHLVLVPEERVYGTLLEALSRLERLPKALGLHSGPSKSADIGQVMVKGVHGPGQLFVAVLSGRPEEG
ncbi:LUD domain-containing protein [Thermus oshimai]